MTHPHVTNILPTHGRLTLGRGKKKASIKILQALVKAIQQTVMFNCASFRFVKVTYEGPWFDSWVTNDHNRTMVILKQ